LFAGADSGGRHWAIVATLIQSAKLNDVDPLAWLTDVLERIVAGHTRRHELATLLPWAWEVDKPAEAPSSVQMPRGSIHRAPCRSATC
jgi:transposase